MSIFHAIVWLDHDRAQLLQFDASQAFEKQIKAHLYFTRHDGNEMRSVHEFFGEVCDALAGVEQLLVAGPHAVQEDFRHYVDKLRPEVASQIVEWQTLDHPSPGELIALARRYFATHDATAGAQA
ncbi:hypothetical protein [Acidovorax soli]|uniref:Translational machinery protein n=1 Tax=Acidovorax soli TaxID=592050 RepID=A0A1H4FC48_9BURK|nr:hypothetical protein [Acidovorax soli]MBU2049270.1 hypothetical protein [Gammaproteobacteria bacterium]SEA94440.1 hypothetical protein SAMN05421875_1534 [Acidovorax soli]